MEIVTFGKVLGDLLLRAAGLSATQRIHPAIEEPPFRRFELSQLDDLPTEVAPTGSVGIPLPIAIFPPAVPFNYPTN